MTRIAHLSDIHLGRISRPEIVEVVVEEVNALAVDLVVVSGDLTQRARPYLPSQKVDLSKGPYRQQIHTTQTDPPIRYKMALFRCHLLCYAF